jgi:8-oxo-dGTP pyrophosphatase MutT (NUDIX family)
MPPTRDFTATTFIVHQGRTLLIYHRKIRAWFPPGGHIDPGELPCDAAVREVREETGLDVALTSRRTRLGEVEVLPRPECVLLEDISVDHQHIDLIYFAKVTGGRVDIARHEADAFRWCTCADLDDPEIHEDIRVLGKRAIEAVSREHPEGVARDRSAG